MVTVCAVFVDGPVVSVFFFVVVFYCILVNVLLRCVVFCILSSFAITSQKQR